MSDEKFWSHVDRGDEEDCWEWTGGLCGGRKERLYGAFNRSRKLGGRRTFLAHRVAYCLANDIDLSDLHRDTVIRHKCDNTKCCNPTHLESGTQQDNVADALKRDRVAKGTNVAGALLDEQKVREIRLLLKTGTYHDDIALQYDVHRVTITNIATGRSWGWVS